MVVRFETVSYLSISLSRCADQRDLAFQTAVALAVYDAKHGGEGPVPKVKEKHLKQVVSMSSAFKKYIKATHNDKDLSDRSFERGNRDDRVSMTPKK